MAVRLLCAFQNDEIFAFVKSALAAYDIEYLKATSEALGLYLTQKNFPSLVICELVTGENWGLNLLAELKAEDELKEIPVIFVAQRNARVSTHEPELPSGAELILSYPIENYEFVTAVSKYLCEVKDEREPQTPE